MGHSFFIYSFPIMRFPYYLCLIALLFLTSCDKEDSDTPNTTKQRTVLVYMMAENNLNENATANIRSMTENMTQEIANHNNLIVYIDGRSVKPVLLRITEQSCDTLKTYSEQNSVQVSVMSSVIHEVIQSYPAESYGLVFWGHGTGWLPATMDSRYSNNLSVLSTFNQNQDPASLPKYIWEQPSTTSMGTDNSTRYIELADLTQAIPSHVFDFIGFDVCLMGSVEVVYQLREKANYFIASAVEILSTGFIYEDFTRVLFEEDPYLKLGETYFNSYNNRTERYHSAGIAVIKASELDSLAASFKAVVDPCDDAIAAFDLSTIQQLDRCKYPTHMDLLDFVKKISTDSEKCAAFETQLNKTVLYKNCTPSLWEEVTVSTYCGLSVFVPISNYSDLHTSYRATEWSTTTGY